MGCGNQTNWRSSETCLRVGMDTKEPLRVLERTGTLWRHSRVAEKEHWRSVPQQQGPGQIMGRGSPTCTPLPYVYIQNSRRSRALVETRQGSLRTTSSLLIQNEPLFTMSNGWSSQRAVCPLTSFPHSLSLSRYCTGKKLTISQIRNPIFM